MEPIYTLKIEEGVLIPEPRSKREIRIRTAVIVILILLLLASVLFQENILHELNWIARMMLLFLVVKYFIFWNKKIDVPSPMELCFFGEYLLLYRPKRYYSKRVTRKEYIKMNYNEIEKIKYKKNERQFQIYGTVIAKFYRYLSENETEQRPSYDKTVEGTLCYFSTRCTDDDDNFIMYILEKYSRCKVDIE